VYQLTGQKKKLRGLSPRANYTNGAKLVPTSADRGVSRISQPYRPPWPAFLRSGCRTDVKTKEAASQHLLLCHVTKQLLKHQQWVNISANNTSPAFTALVMLKLCTLTIIHTDVALHSVPIRLSLPRSLGLVMSIWMRTHPKYVCIRNS
jgi:hypothetical protein